MRRWNEDGRFDDRMFEDGNGISFDSPVDDDAKAWWREAFFDKHGWTPEHVGDMLSKSWPGEKSIAVTVIDGREKRCSIKVRGAFGEGDFWLGERTVDLLGPAINADRMFVSVRRRGDGLGRRFMRDLMGFADVMGIQTIRLDAGRVGRYAWLRTGFLPDRGSWNRLKAELAHRLSAAPDDLGRERFGEILGMIQSPHPETARELAALADPVASLELLDEFGSPRKVPVGRALFLEIASDWSGELRLGDATSRRIADLYVRDASQ